MLPMRHVSICVRSSKINRRALQPDGEIISKGHLNESSGLLLDSEDVLNVLEERFEQRKR